MIEDDEVINGNPYVAEDSGETGSVIGFLKTVPRQIGYRFHLQKLNSVIEKSRIGLPLKYSFV